MVLLRKRYGASAACCLFCLETAITRHRSSKDNGAVRTGVQILRLLDFDPHPTATLRSALQEVNGLREVGDADEGGERGVAALER